MVIEEIKPNLYVQKTRLGEYRVVYPIKKDLDKSFTWDNIHWKNLCLGSGWGNIITLAVFLLVVSLMAYGYAHDTELCRDVKANPQKYIYGWDGNNMENIDPSEINLSAFENWGDIDEGNTP